ncbi:MAG: LURP-one-related family protein [Saccharofermentans sp.]|nr:LURP-one-related family protein [Saccharofermentans sp.]
MGITGKVNRFREAGEQANVNNVDRFGEPAKSLFTTSKVFTLHHHIDITDGAENVVYQANTKFPSLHDKTDITDAQGNQVAHIEKKFFTLHERHFVTMADGKKFEVSNELFHIIKDITNLEGLGWQLRGNILGLNFELYDENGGVIAVIAQKLISIHDKYCIDIYQPVYEKEVVAILITLQHIIKDRENAQAASSSSSSSSSS